MPMPDPATAAAKWAQNFGASSQRWQDGVNAVTVSPGAAAARQKAVYVQNVTTAADKWARKLSAMTAEQWKQQTITKGSTRFASGAQAGQPKIEQAFTTLLPHIQQTVNSLPPRGDLSQNINRMVAFVQGMAKYQAR